MHRPQFACFRVKEREKNESALSTKSKLQIQQNLSEKS